MLRGRSTALALLIACAAAAPTGLATRDAHASVSVAATWDALVHDSSFAALVTPTSATSVWEDGRIYTYSQVHVDQAVAGDAAGAEDVWVRTMGGIVGNVGQIVDGEAVLTMGRPCLLFLHPGPASTLQVTARGQGQFPVVLDQQSARRLVRSSSVGALIQPKRVGQPPAPAAAPVLAADKVHGRLVDDVARDVAAVWQKAHAK